jgi:hypothetical protein
MYLPTGLPPKWEIDQMVGLLSATGEHEPRPPRFDSGRGESLPAAPFIKRLYLVHQELAAVQLGSSFLNR